MVQAEHEVRIHFDFSLWPEVDNVVKQLIGRDPSFAGTDTCSGERLLGYSCEDKAEAVRLRRLLATCPEVRIVEPVTHG